MSDALTTRGIVLRAVPYGEADLVVTLLGRGTGLVSTIARSSRKSQRRFGGGLGLGATGQMVVRERGNADLLVLEQFDVETGRTELGGDLGRTAHLAYALELCDRLCAPRQPETAVFDWLEQFLDLLGSRGAGVERLRAFELGLLGRLGMGPAFAACVACGRSDLDQRPVRLQPQRGGVLCADCARSGTPIHPSARAALERLSGVPLADADASRLSRDDNAACRRAIFELIEPHLASPLKSLMFIEKLGAG
jgi:DNA repair protein RecO (recombination protein O)